MIWEVLRKLCEICKQSTCRSQCPNYKSPKTTYYCSSCGDGIFAGEKYMENQYGEYRHYECFQGMNELLEWLGYEIKIMEE